MVSPALQPPDDERTNRRVVIRMALREIAHWLKVSADDGAVAAMIHAELSPFACVGPSGAGMPGGNDPQFLVDPVPHAVALPSDLDAPAEWTGSAALWSSVAPMGMCLGYGAGL